jgi:hypothetical protein
LRTPLLKDSGMARGLEKSARIMPLWLWLPVH